MRQSVILPDRVQNVFFNEAEKSGLVIPLDNIADDLYPPDELREANALYKSALDKRDNEKQSIFRMLMLFDNIILPNVVDYYDYDKLINTELFSIYFLEDFMEFDPIHEEGHKEYAMYLKPAIVPVYEKILRSYFRIGETVGSFSDFASDLYDVILVGKGMPLRHKSFWEANKKYFNIRNKHSFNDLRNKFGSLPDILLEKRRFETDLYSWLITLYQSLCWNLKISSEKDAAIWDCEFQLANIGCDSYSSDISYEMEAYNILRVECSKIIGTLPEVNSIQEVIRLKENRRNDLHNLRQELSRLEYEIRNGSSLKAVEKAAKDISKASKALSRGNTVRQVTKWVNFFALPVSTASLFAEKPEIAIGSGILTVIGQTLSFVETTIKDKNKWFEMII